MAINVRSGRSPTKLEVPAYDEEVTSSQEGEESLKTQFQEQSSNTVALDIFGRPINKANAQPRKSDGAKVLLVLGGIIAFSILFAIIQAATSKPEVARIGRHKVVEAVDPQFDPAARLATTRRLEALKRAEEKRAEEKLASEKALEQRNSAKIADAKEWLRKVPDRQYETRLSLWAALTKYAPANKGYAAGKLKAEQALASVKDATENPELLGASIEKMSGNIGGFGNILFVNVTIRNDALSHLKDFQITCSILGNSGSEIGSVSRTLYETVEARSSKSFKRLNMGFVDQQLSTFRCAVMGASLG